MEGTSIINEGESLKKAMSKIWYKDFKRNSINYAIALQSVLAPDNYVYCYATVLI